MHGTLPKLPSATSASPLPSESKAWLSWLALVVCAAIGLTLGLALGLIGALASGLIGLC
jgi:hypothetical protein